MASTSIVEKRVVRILDSDMGFSERKAEVRGGWLIMYLSSICFLTLSVLVIGAKASESFEVGNEQTGATEVDQNPIATEASTSLSSIDSQSVEASTRDGGNASNSDDSEFSDIIPVVLSEGKTVFRGVILDDQANRIRNARLWLCVGTDEESIETNSDEQGLFEFTLPDWRPNDPKFVRTSVTLWGYAPECAIACIDINKWLNRVDHNPVVMKLESETIQEFRVTTVQGEAVLDYFVETYTYNNRVPPREFKDLLRAKSDAQGFVRVANASEKGLDRLVIGGPGIGRQVVLLRKSPSDQLLRVLKTRNVGTLEIQLQCDQPVDFSKFKYSLRAEQSFGIGSSGDYGSVAKDGKIVLPSVTVGKCSIAIIASDNNQEYLPLAPKFMTVLPGEVTKVTIPMEKTVKVTGVLSEVPSGRPIPIMELSVALNNDGSVIPVHQSPLFTDLNGRYSFRVLPGEIRLEACGDYARYPSYIPRGSLVSVPFTEKEWELPPMFMVDSIVLDVQVVDSDDKPVAGMSVYTNPWTSSVYQTDSEGRFKYRNAVDRQLPAFMVISSGESTIFSPRKTEVVSKDPVILRVQ